MIKKILYIFIPILAVLLMSHNAGALSTTLNLDNYEIKSPIRSPALRCGYNDGSFDNACVMTNSLGVTKYFSSISFELAFTNYAFKAGDIVEFDFSFYSDSVSGSYNFGVMDFLTNSSNLQIISIQEFVNDSYENVNGGSNISTNILITKRYHFTLMAYADYNGTLLFSTPNLVTWTPSGQRSSISLKATNYFVYRKRANASSDDQKNEINATNNAVNDSENSGSSSTTSSTSATSSLLSVITSGIGAITSASPTNCKINGNMGNLNVGNIDLCANPVPTFMALIGSIIAVLVVLPLVILLFNRFISIIRSFQT